MAQHGSPRWFLDEVATAGRENLDAAHVCAYDTKEDAQAAAEVALLRDYGLGEGSRVIDLGAGTGQFTLAAAQVGAQVTAVDVSPVMLDRLRDNVAQTGLDNVTVVQGGFLTYEHTETPVDLIYTRFALHHVPDFWKALALERMHAMLAPGGVLRLWDVIFDMPPAEAVAQLDAWCATFDGAEPGEWTRQDVEDHLRDEHSTFRWLIEPMLHNAGFDIRDVAYSEDGIFGRYIAGSAKG